MPAASQNHAFGGRRCSPLPLLLLLWLCRQARVVRADFGDAVDPTFDCPAFTTCQQVCVTAAEDCPEDMLCPANETLCNDGSCAALCDPGLVSPCPHPDCAPVACPKVNSYYSTCLQRYGPWYANETACADAAEEELHDWTMREPAFVVCYAWIGCLTAAIVGWCAYNQRVAPVPGAAQPLNVQVNDRLEVAGGGGGGATVSSWQTGYRTHALGTVLYCWTVLTLLAIHALLAWLSVQYYVQQEALGGKRNLRLVFPDEANLLKVFEILWMVGFVFSFALKWPFSLRSLFLRRCALERATHVAVCIYKPASAAEETFQAGYLHCVRLVLSRLGAATAAVMTFLFSDVDAYGSRKGRNGNYRFCRVQTDEEGTRYFVFGFRHYNFDLGAGRFQPGVYSVGRSVADMVAAGRVKGGLSSAEASARRRVVGPNAIEMVPPNALKIMRKEFGKAFYTYQAFMVWTWVPLWYYYMAFTWAVVITVGGVTVCYFQYRNERKLYQITHMSGEVSVFRDGECLEMSPKELVPGDIVSVQPGLTYCDMIVLSSSTALIDESALTGEATPMLKTAIDELEGDKDYSPTKHKRNTILAGTRVLETEDTLGLVTQTASYTARGELIRDTYSYKRHQFKFDVEIPIVITVLCFYAIFGFAMVVYFIQDEIVYSWFYGMFVVATVLPPLLPTVFTVSVGISSDRLAQKQISCANPDAILVAGKVNVGLFDKTGTLTKQGLDFVAATPHEGYDLDFSLALASCHTLSVMQNGELVGNPVDRELFAKSGAVANTTSGPIDKVTDRQGQAASIVKHFDFDHHRMTQSVILQKSSDNSLVAFVKGSGESIKKLSDSRSLPHDFDEALHQAAISGVYQISVAMKHLPPSTDISQISRDEIESKLTFIGTVDFKNVIRPETPAVISHLQSGRVRTVMVTGDSVLTGITIAKEAGIFRPDTDILIGNCDDSDAVYWCDLDGKRCALPPVEVLGQSGTELALSGKAWDVLRTTDPKIAARLADLVQVYGRCTPYDKVSIVTAFNELGRITLMCGDGGNDCGALKTAHVGVALSDAEASTVAPFTSLEKVITSVVDVVLEGRCSLASSLAAYKYMIMYGQVETINQIVNAYFSITFSEWCWVFMDGVWTITMAFSLPLARCATELSKTSPTASLLGPHTLASTLGILGINFLFLVGALSYLWHQDWFQCRKWGGQDVSNVQVIGDNYESEVIFLVTGYQYISSAIAYSFGYEWRQAWYRNYVFVAFATAFTVMQFYITLVPGYFSCIWRVNCENEWVLPSVTTKEPMPIQNSFNTTVMPIEFRRGLIGLMVGNALAIAGWDFFVVNGIRQRLAEKRREKKSSTKTNVTGEGQKADETDTNGKGNVEADSEVA